jgi:hypothetical protein
LAPSSLQERVLVATTRTDGGGMETFSALQPAVRMVATVGESATFAALFALGLADSHTPVGVEYQLPVIGGITVRAALGRLSALSDFS